MVVEEVKKETEYLNKGSSNFSREFYSKISKAKKGETFSFFVTRKCFLGPVRVTFIIIRSFLFDMYMK